MFLIKKHVLNYIDMHSVIVCEFLFLSIWELIIVRVDKLDKVHEAQYTYITLRHIPHSTKSFSFKLSAHEYFTFEEIDPHY
jgi:hypothetical protein